MSPILGLASQTCLLAVLAVLPVVVGCEISQEWPSAGRFAGDYSYGGDISLFIPKGSTENWWLVGSIPCLATSYPQTHESPVIYLEVQGNLSTKGSYGNFGLYARELQVTSVHVCQVVGAADKIKQGRAQ